MGKQEIKPKLLKANQSGFTLIEVMIAIAIFATFATVFVTGFGYNLLDSGQLKENIVLKDLCENKINELITNPPAYADSLTLTKETKDIEGYPNYQTIVEYKKMFIPEMSKIMGTNGAEETAEQKQQNQLTQKIFAVFKENMEKMIWQVEVTVKNKTSGETFKLSSWLYNSNADVKIGNF